MVANAVARRGFLRVLGMIPAFAPLAKSTAASVFARAEPLAAAAGVAGSIGPPSPSLPGEEHLGKFLARQVRDLNDQIDSEEGHAYHFRESGIDPDIASIKSTSRTYKVMKMMERRREITAMQFRIRRLWWP